MCLAKPCWLLPNPRRDQIPTGAFLGHGSVRWHRTEREWGAGTPGWARPGDTEGLNLAGSREEPAPFQPEQTQHPAKILLQDPNAWIINRNPGRVFLWRSDTPCLIHGLQGRGAGNAPQHNPAWSPKTPQDLSWDTTRLSGFLLWLQPLQLHPAAPAFIYLQSGWEFCLCFPLFLNLFIFILDF